MSSLPLILFGYHRDWLRVSSLDPSLSLGIDSVTLSYSVSFSVPQFPPLCNGNNRITYLLGLMRAQCKFPLSSTQESVLHKISA